MIAPGDRIDGRYDVEALLGTGGMAIVYRARHAGTGAACALKVVHPHLVARRALVDLFLKEARAFGRIGKSEHVVEVLDAGFDGERGLPYLVMELLEGETLDAWCERHGPMPPALVQSVFEQLAEALDQAHDAGIVHRDVKPSNLFLTTGRRGRPTLKVMDFGIAKVIEAGAARTATQVGTPSYAAPEQMGAAMREVAARQAIAVAASVSRATDVWPLGLVAYELLTGLPSGQFWGAETAAEIPVKAVLVPREAASVRAEDRAVLLPAGFDAWFARATATDAAERWPSVGAATEALGRLLAQMPAGEGTPFARIAGASRSIASDAGATEVSQAPPAASGGATEVVWSSAPPLVPAPPQLRAEAPPTQRRPRARRWAVPIGAALAFVAATVAAVVIVPRLRVSAARDACRSTGERCAEACDDGDAATCALIAGRAERGDGVPRDVVRAAALYQRACAGNDAAGCAGLGRLVRAGNGGLDRDRARAVGLFRRACDGGDARGCALLGESYRDGAGTARDLVRAAALFQSACDRGDLLSCNDLGGLHQLGRGGLARDERKAAELYRRACDGGELVGCSDLGVLVGAGRGGYARDDHVARELYQRACDGGELIGCHNLGALHEQGRGDLARDEARAAELYRRACDGGEPRGCGSLGAMFEAGRGGVPLDIARARSLYQDACDGGDAHACRRLGALYEHGKGGLARDEARAVALYQRACEAGDMRGCNDLGFMSENGKGGLGPSDERAAELYERACDGGEMIGCANFAVMLSAGRGVARDESRAVALYQRACEAGTAAGCAGLGWAYLAGRGATRDRARGIELLRRGCTGGNAWSCERLREAGAR
ncbi:Hypothetical protein A7982_03175 [Minicystis rosea]|nr:Hypothetical protein A7982_03175 [Minicystis rosea]